MIIVEIVGGLGNQFFDYAIAYALARKNNTSVLLDKNSYHMDYWRKFVLDEFNLDFQDAIMEKPFDKIPIVRFIYRRLIYNRLLKFKLRFLYRARHIPEKEWFAYQDFGDISGNVYLTGYWQNYRYFHDYRDEFIRQFTLKNPSQEAQRLAELARNEKAAALHLRRGDYITWGKCLDINFYYKAIDMMRNDLGVNSPIWVFTEDVQFAELAFKNIDNVKYFKDIERETGGEKVGSKERQNKALTDIEEFYVMSNCHNFITANSTFSWWAAYLSNANPHEKQVISPIVDIWTSDFYLPEWHTIKAELAN